MPHEEVQLPGTRRVKLRDVNAHLACVLCGGYLVDATTIVECLHSFCRSCIIKYLDTNNFCPICDVQIHKAKPFLNIKPDKTLQDIVYKLVPGLFQAEMRRRRDFYALHPEQIALTTPEERGVGVERIIYSPEDSISLSLEYYDSGHPGAEDGEAKNSPECADPGEQPMAHKRYLQCPAVVTIGHLKKFLRLKYDLSTVYRVDVIHRGVCLPEDYTLMDVAYIYTWKRSEPMEFMYRIHEPPSNRRRKRQADEMGIGGHLDATPPKLERMTEGAPPAIDSAKEEEKQTVEEKCVRQEEAKVEARRLETRRIPTPKKAVEAPHAIARPHSAPGAASPPHHPQQLPSPRPASSPPALIAQQTQASARVEEKGEGAKRDRNGALDLSGGSSRLSGEVTPPVSDSHNNPTADGSAALPKSAADPSAVPTTESGSAVDSNPSESTSKSDDKNSSESNEIAATSTSDSSTVNTNTSVSATADVATKNVVTGESTPANSLVSCASITSNTTTTSTTTTRVSTSTSPQTSRQGKITKGQSTQTLQSIAQNLARNAQQKQLQQQLQQKAPLKTQQSPQTQQKPLQHVTPLQTPKYTSQTKLQQQTHHQIMQQQLQQHIQQHNQQQLQAQLLRQQQIQQIQLQQSLRNSQGSKTSIGQSKIPNSTSTNSSTDTTSSSVTITIASKSTPARQNSPSSRSNSSPVNAVSPQTKSSGLTLSLGQLNHHNALTNNRPSPKRGAQIANNNFLQNNSLHHLPHISISQTSNSTSPASATSPGYSDPLSPLLSPFSVRTGNLRSPPLAPPPPPPTHSSLRIPVPPSGKPSSLSSSSPSPSPPGDQHSSTPSPHQKASPNGSPGRHDHFASHHLHAMFSPHGIRLRQQMELQNRHIAEIQQAAHQQSSAQSANPQLLQQWHQLQQLHLRQAANANQSTGSLSSSGYPMDWYSYPHSVKLLEYFMKLGHLPMFPFNNNTTSANNNSANNARK